MGHDENIYTVEIIQRSILSFFYLGNKLLNIGQHAATVVRAKVHLICLASFLFSFLSKTRPLSLSKDTGYGVCYSSLSKCLMEEKQKKLCLEYTNMNQQISCAKEQTAKITTMQPQAIYKQRAWLCLNKTLFTKNRCWAIVYKPLY